MFGGLYHGYSIRLYCGLYGYIFGYDLPFPTTSARKRSPRFCTIGMYFGHITNGKHTKTYHVTFLRHAVALKNSCFAVYWEQLYFLGNGTTQ
jgi:hypothetical protein